MIEIVFAFSFLAVGLLAFASLSGTGHGQARHNRERRIALEAARAQVAELWSYPDFAACFSAFDANAGNDPPDTRGNSFDVPGLTPQPGDLDGVAGEVLFPVAPPAVGGTPVLREDLDLPEFGLPHDLDGDGLIDDQPKDNTYVHLPVVVRVAWTGRNGDQEVRVRTWITPWEMR